MWYKRSAATCCLYNHDFRSLTWVVLLNSVNQNHIRHHLWVAWWTCRERLIYSTREWGRGWMMSGQGRDWLVRPVLKDLQPGEDSWRCFVWRRTCSASRNTVYRCWSLSPRSDFSQYYLADIFLIVVLRQIPKPEKRELVNVAGKDRLWKRRVAAFR